MSKKIRYREPDMPESLRKLLELDVEDPRFDDYYRKNRSSKTKRPQSTSNSKKKAIATKKSTHTKKKLGTSKSNDQRKNSHSSRLGDLSKSSKTNNSASNANLRKERSFSNRNHGELDKRPKKSNKRAEIHNSNKYKLDKEDVVKNNRNAIKNKSSNIKRNTYIGDRRKSSQSKPKSHVSISGILFYIFNLLRMLIDFVINGGDKKLYINKENKKKLDKSYFRVNTAILFVIVFVLLLLNIVTPSNKISEAENRTLAQAPKFSIDRLIHGKYGEDFSTYVSDQFVFRKNFIKTKANFDRFMGKKEINGVYICKDDYLMEGFKRSDDKTTDAKVKAINNFSNKNKSIKVSVLLAPNKVEVYNNLMPTNAPVDSQKEYLNYVKKGLDDKIKFVDALDPMLRAKNNEQLYFRTDHHWTVDGAYLAYKSYCKTLNIEPVGLNSFTKSLATDKFYGSLYYKNAAQIGKPDKLEMYLQQNDLVVLSKYYDTKKKIPSLYDAEKLDTKDPYQVFTGGNHTQIKIRTNVDTDRKLLIFKDSYANAMLPFLVNNYSEIMVVDLRYYTGKVQDLTSNGSFTDALILANTNTFNTDSSILNLNY